MLNLAAAGLTVTYLRGTPGRKFGGNWIWFGGCYGLQGSEMMRIEAAPGARVQNQAGEYTHVACRVRLKAVSFAIISLMIDPLFLTWIKAEASQPVILKKNSDYYGRMCHEVERRG
jgi:hypothetical protein